MSVRVIVWGIVFALAATVGWWVVSLRQPNADTSVPLDTAVQTEPILNNVTVDEDGTIRLKQ
jgi:hypothetical protein